MDMKQQNTINLGNLFSIPRSEFLILAIGIYLLFAICDLKFSHPLCLSAFVAQVQSIKMIKICKTNPIWDKIKFLINSMKTTSYSEKIKLDTWSKQTQTNPILSAFAVGKIVPSAVEWPVKTAIAASAQSQYNVSTV